VDVSACVRWWGWDSRTLDHGFWIQDPGFRTLDPEFWIPDPDTGPWIPDLGFRTLDPTPWFQGSRILDPGLWIPAPDPRLMRREAPGEREDGDPPGTKGKNANSSANRSRPQINSSKP